MVLAGLALGACASGVRGESWSVTASSVVPTAPSTTTSTLTTKTTTSTTSTTTSTTSTTTTSPGIDPRSFEAFDAVIRAGTLGAGARAVSVALARDGQVLHVMAAGLAGPATGASVSPESRFRVASISKVLTSATVLQLVEEGRVGLDEPVVERLAVRVGASAVGPDVARVTVRQLLSHTSGLPKGEQHYFADGSTTTCPQAARRAIEGGLTAPAGVRFQYSNTNYCLLGLLLEDREGVPYEEVVRRRLLHPVGVGGMEVVGTYETPLGGAVHPARPGRSFMEALGGAGAWVATAGEIALVVSSIDNDTAVAHPLSEPTVALMRTPVPAQPPGLDWTYGLGLRLWGDGSWGHTGTLEQTRAIAVVRPDGWTAVVLVSGERPRTSDELRALVADALAAGSLNRSAGSDAMARRFSC